MKSSASALAAATLASVALAQRTTIGCSDVHIFLAKGNNEPYPGRQSSLITAICSGLEKCDYEDVQFDNALEDEYCGSVEEGARNGAAQIKAYHEKCPDSKLVVSGYSQGGHVVGDILGGGGGVFFQDCVQGPNPAFDRSSSAGKKIVAALIFGDTRHTANQAYNFETGADKDGLFPRPDNQLSGMNVYTDILRNYCVGTDPICAQGEVGETHLNYFDIFSESAGEWVREMVANASEGEETSSTSATSTRTTAASSTAETTEAAETTTEAESTTPTTEIESSETTQQTTATEESTTAAARTSASETDETDETKASSPASTTATDEEDGDSGASSPVPSLSLVGLVILAALAT